LGLASLTILANTSWCQSSCTADLNDDQVINLHDLLALLVHYGDSCSPDMATYPTINISEIHYNPNSAQGNDSDWEFLELHNPHPYPIGLQDWSLQNAVSFSFSANDTIPEAGFFVIARNLDSLASVLPFDVPAKQWNAGESLNNTGETIELRAPDASLVMAISYEDNDGWVTEPDGMGPSLEWMDTGLANDQVDSWTYSLIFGGTPGAQNSMWGLSDPE